MKRLFLAALILAAPIGPFGQPQQTSVLYPTLWGDAALAQQVSPKEAFEAAKELGTVDAWNAFLASYPSGFYSDLARAYLKRLNEAAGAPAPSAAPVVAAPAPGPAPAGGFSFADLPPTDPTKPAVARGGDYMGFPERFNRYYTDPTWKPSRVVYVSPNGNGTGAGPDSPMAVRAAMAAVRPGTMIVFLRGQYQGCFELTKANSGTYDEPVVLFGERNPDQTLGVVVTCCSSGRQTCINLEYADYVAVDGFELAGGRFGVRAVGEGYAASQHSRGIAVIDCFGHDQNNDPFFSGQVDWAIWERNLATGAKAGDGHGIYLSNGGDWNIVRFNETHSNVSSDFQINADPAATCKEVGIAFNDPRCDAYAGTGEGGQGASDYFLVDGNYFHHGTGNGSGANFTSVRRSVIRNNVFGFQPRHGVSFWQETDNPRLGASENKVVHNLFITANNRHALQFINHSDRNEVANNIMLGVRTSGSSVTANPSSILLGVDGTVGANTYRSNLYLGGKVEGRAPNAQETARADFSPGWFTRFPTALNRDPGDFKPTSAAPFLGLGAPTALAPTDRTGAGRVGQADPGPIAVR